MLKVPPPKRKLYRYYKAFDENSLKTDLKSKLVLIKILDYSSFEDIFINVLNTHAPIKIKIKRANNHEFMAKPLCGQVENSESSGTSEFCFPLFLFRLFDFDLL